MSHTQSVCPVCLKRIDAEREEDGNRVYLRKTCEEHGTFRTLIWNGPPDYSTWNRCRPSVTLHRIHTDQRLGCPYDCGICAEHQQNTCCVLLEVTQRCSLNCPVCFAGSGMSHEEDPDLEAIAKWFDLLMESGGPFNIQLSGGEPTVRDDLPEIIRVGREKGLRFFQLNTNGLRLAAQADYAQELKAAGLDCVYLQFDGLREEPYIALRGKPLLKEKLRAVENCVQAGLGVVLVPTVAPGVNEQEIRSILDFAVRNLPGVRGVHFQPISYFGRYPTPPEARITIPDMLRSIETQTDGRMRAADFGPGTAENPYCSFNASYLLQPDGTLKPMNKAESCCCGGESSRAQTYVAEHWSAPACCEKSLREKEPHTMEEFIERTRQYTLAVSGMVFQDAWNLDLERLRQCYIHVVSPDLRVIPFCAYNLTSISGKSLYRRAFL